MEKIRALEQVKNIFEELKDYIELRYNLGRLQLTEKIVLITSFFITFFVILMIFLVFFMFLSFSLAFYLGHIMNYVPYGFLAVGAIYFVIGIVVYTLRKTMITNPVLKLMLRIMFKSDDKKSKK